MAFEPPILLMLIGIPGSGKSSWLKNLKVSHGKYGGTYLIYDAYPGDQIPFYVICPDDIRKRICGNVNDQSKNDRVWAIAKEETNACLVHGTNVILDATNVQSIYRRSFVSGLFFKTLLAKTFYVEPEIACERIKRNITEGIDRPNVPEDIIYRMYGEFLYTRRVLSSEGFQLI